MRREGVTHGRQEKYVTDTDIESMQYSPKQGRTGHHRGSEKQEHSKKKQIEHIAKPDPVKPIVRSLLCRKYIHSC